jgi:uncharacterized RDD family membrane protein YckC
MSARPDRVLLVPREARGHQGRHAGVVTRLVAAALDAAVVVTVLLCGYGMVAVLVFLSDPLRFSLPRLSWVVALSAALAFTVVYLAVGWSAGGRTCGMSIMGLRVVGAGGRRLRLVGATARALACVVFPVGLLWSAVNARNRSVQDVLLHTEVIYDWRH